MTKRYRLSPLARADVERIWVETVKRWGTDQAETYIRQLSHHIEIVSEQPAIGRDCSKIRAGYYKYPSGSHFIFYQPREGFIDVVRILHERMDFKQHL